MGIVDILKQRTSPNNFIEKAVAIHGDKYDYSKVKYKTAKDKVEIICRIHGSFMQCPDKHINAKQGCNNCGNMSISKALSFSKEDFIKQARKAHGDKYDYSEVCYKSAHTKVVIKCPVHGEFKQSPALHVRTYGCKDCGDAMTGKSLAKTLDKFIEDASLAHNNKYDYSKSIYLGAHKKIVIMCPLHGEFEQTPDAHINTGAGCQKCAKHGFKDYEDATLYVLRSECGSFIKIGISNEPHVRFRKLKRSTPFYFGVIESFKSLGSNARLMESKFHKVFKNAGFKGFDGATEWFHYDNEKLKQLIKHGQEMEIGGKHEK